MKVKLMSLWAGLATLAVVAVPVTALACNGSNQDKNTQETNTSIPTESSVTVEETFAS